MIPYAADIVTQYAPWYYLVSESIKNFSLPHWVNGLYGSGYPLLAQGETGVLSPINLLVLFLLPFPLSINFLYVVYGGVAMVGTYFFLKNNNLDSISSIFGALVFILSGFFLSRYFQPSIIFTAALLPWGFLAIHKAITEEKALFLLAPLIFLQATAGHLQIVLISIAAYTSYAILLNLFFKNKPNHLIKITILIGLGLIISSLQLVPSFKLFQFSERQNWDRNVLYSYSLPPSHLITYPVPSAFGVSQPGNDFGFRQFGGGFWELNITIWTLPFLLSLVPLILIFSKRKKRSNLVKITIIFYIIWLIFTLVSLGGFFKPNLIFAKIPDFPFRAPARFMLISTFVSSTLCAIGFAQLSKLFSKALSVIFLTIIISVSLLQAGDQLKDYFIFENSGNAEIKIEDNIKLNKLWTPLVLDNSLRNNYTQKEMEKIFKNQFYTGALLSLIGLAIFIYWYKKETGKI